MLLKPLFKTLFNKDPDGNYPEISIDLSDINIDILEAILIHLDKKTLIKCKGVCKKWNNLINTKSFWISKEELDGDNYLKNLVDSDRISVCLQNYGKLSILRPYNRNLLMDFNPKNVRHQYLKHSDPRWHFDNGGNGWLYEEPPSFFNDRFDPEFQPLFNSALSTSFQLCTKKMDLDMESLGIDIEVLDNFRPPIVFSEWVSHRSDCGAMYRMGLRFYDVRDVCLASEQQEISFEQWALQKWHKMEVTLKSYPRGCRTLRVYSSGRDTQFWAGNYGVKIAGSQLIVRLESSPPSTSQNPAGDSRTSPME